MEHTFITAGTVVNTHGVRGEAKILPQGVEPELLAGCGTLYLDGAPCTVSACRVHKGCLLVKFKGVGKIEEVLSYPAHKVYVLRGGRDEFLVPAVPAFIAGIDLAAGTVDIHMMEGLGTHEN